jgi:hypothetical protein
VFQRICTDLDQNVKPLRKFMSIEIRIDGFLSLKKLNLRDLAALCGYCLTLWAMR